MKHQNLREQLKAALHFATLADAERSLRTIHALHETCRAAHDRTGMELCRQRILDGKKRAGFIARNPKVSPRKQAQKKEIHLWFSLWLENAETFFVWLELRKKTGAFQDLSAAEESVE